MGHKKIFIPQAKLDLHGMTLEQAFNAFKLFIESSYNKGITRLLVIHGIGSGVMKENVYKWCDSLLFPFIKEYSQAPVEYGAEGAVTIIIEKQKDYK